MKKSISNIKIYKKMLLLSFLSVILVKDDVELLVDNYVPYFNDGNIDKYNDSINKKIRLNIDEKYVPQGMCLTRDKIIVSLYKYKYDDYSCLYVIDKKTNQYKKVMLDIYAHCGGVTYDDVNNNIWVSANNGCINCYKLDDILNDNKVYNIDYYDCSGNLDNYQGKQSVSYLTYHEGKMYVGNFNVLSSKTIMKIYEVNGTKLNYINEVKMPNYIQGITFCENDMILSRSYGQKNTSQIVIYDYNNSKTNYKKEYRTNITAPSLQQQLIIEDDKLYILYESNSDIYQNELLESEDIVVVDYKKLVK